MKHDKVYYCVVCGKNIVDPYQGEDTCIECIKRIRRGGDESDELVKQTYIDRVFNGH